MLIEYTLNKDKNLIIKTTVQSKYDITIMHFPKKILLSQNIYIDNLDKNFTILDSSCEYYITNSNNDSNKSLSFINNNKTFTFTYKYHNINYNQNYLHNFDIFYDLYESGLFTTSILNGYINFLFAYSEMDNSNIIKIISELDFEICCSNMNTDGTITINNNYEFSNIMIFGGTNAVYHKTDSFIIGYLCVNDTINLLDNLSIYIDYYKYVADFFGYNNSSHPYLFTTLHYVTNKPGLLLNGSIMNQDENTLTLGLSNNNSLKLLYLTDPNTKNVFTKGFHIIACHEILHNWINGKNILMNDLLEMQFYIEGLTEFISQLLAYKFGLVFKNKEDFIDNVNNYIRNYKKSNIVHIPNSKYGIDNNWDYNLIYTRGFILFLKLYKKYGITIFKKYIIKLTTQTTFEHYLDKNIFLNISLDLFGDYFKTISHKLNIDI
jgi:hypothetical protein